MSNFNIDLDFIKNTLEDKKAENINIIDMGDKNHYTDYLIICEGTNQLHNKAIATNARKKLKGQYKILGSEGMDSGDWILMDYGDFVIHIFLPKTRKHYDLDTLMKEFDKFRNDQVRGNND